MRRDIDALTTGVFDLLVIGGGITGAGVALDATLRGLRVALVDKGDFASATSSASSKLIHGGLRYLEHGAFSLVYEALHERTLLLRNAPHLVRPLRFVLPMYANDRLPPWKWRFGLAMYDVLAGRGNIRRSAPLSRGRLLKEFSGLTPTNLLMGAEYFDAQMDDARLCLEVLLTAAAKGAHVANYLEALGFDFSNPGVAGVTAHDHIGSKEVRIRARVVVNAAGPFVDHVCRIAGDSSGPYLNPTKGVHVIAPGPALSAAFLLVHPRDHRVFFVLPWMGKRLIGTTDTFCDDPASQVLPEEIAYLLEGYNNYFRPPLEAGMLLGSFAGLRPLLRSRPGEPSSLSREFRIIHSANGLISIAGGKYTTYRSMAEKVTDAVMTRLGRKRRCSTRGQKLHGTPDEPWSELLQQTPGKIATTYSIPPESSRHLVERYGRRAAEVASYVLTESAPTLVAGEPDLAAEFLYQRDHEMAIRPEDFLLRRTHLGLFQPGLLRNPPELLVSIARSS